ncbi:MAG TPA: hypothetical protein VFZ41_03915, partial [Solirubrobacterales bacterium]
MSDLLAGAGILVAAAAAAAAILSPRGRGHAIALFVALLLCPILILADQWNSPQIIDLRDDPAYLAALAAAAAAAAAVLAAVFSRWPIVLPLGIVFALPFRIPLESGGDTANLLV